MLSRIKKLSLNLAMLVTLAVPGVALVAPATASAAASTPSSQGVTAATSADPQSSLCQGASLDVSGNGDCASSTAEGTTKINNIIATVINIFSIIVGVVAVIMIIIGGLKYITSGGDSGNVTSAKNTILYAIIGLVIVALAQFIVKFVLNKITS